MLSPPAASIAHSGTRKASQQGGSFPDDLIFVAALKPKFVVSSAVGSYCIVIEANQGPGSNPYCFEGLWGHAHP